jgi:hypothetical protein
MSQYKTKNMKPIIKIILSILCFNVGTIEAQDIDSVTLSKMKLNFVVPDLPAFSVLGSEPSNLLRPSTPQAFAMSFSEFYQDKKIQIPKAFALEISPALLLNAKKGPLQLERYIKNQTINSLRISIGSSTDSLLSISGRSLAIGARISLINKGDFSIDMLTKIAKELRGFRKNTTEKFLPLFAIKNGIDTTKLDWEDLIFSNEALRKKFNLELDSSENQIQASFLKNIQKIKDDYKKDHWNDEKLDLAFALLSSSPDSLVKNIRFNKIALWLTYAAKTGKNSQLLIGANSGYSKNLLDTSKLTLNKNYFDISVPVRYLIGTNRVKGFIEAQYSHEGKNKNNKIFMNLGTELNVIDGFWLTFYGGLDYQSITKITSIVSNLKLKITLPEKFKLF